MDGPFSYRMIHVFCFVAFSAREVKESKQLHSIIQCRLNATAGPSAASRSQDKQFQQARKSPVLRDGEATRQQQPGARVSYHNAAYAT